ERLEQRRLTAQHDLQKTMAVLLVRAQHSDLIQHVGPETLRFVDDDDGVRLEQDERAQEPFERVEQQRHIRAREGPLANFIARHEAEIAKDYAQDLARGHMRIENQRRKRARAKSFDDGAAQRRFSRAGFSRQEHDALTASQSSQQFLVRTAMRRAKKEEA